MSWSCILIKFLLFYYVGVFKINLATMESFQVDISDILDDKFMPVSLLLQQEPNLEVNNSREHFYENHNKAVGDFSQAFSTMQYHRKMMNEYLCNNFVADEILSELTPEVTKLEKRLGKAAEIGNETLNNHRMDEDTPQERLRFDQGSIGYKNWLSKTTTLDDIYKQFEENGGDFDVQKRKSIQGDSSNRRQRYDVVEVVDDDYEEGDVTGYAIHRPLQSDIQQSQIESSADSNIYSTLQHPHLSHNSRAHSKNGAFYHNFENMFYPQHITFHNHDGNPSHHYPIFEATAGNHIPTHVEGYYPTGQETYDDYETHSYRPPQNHGIQNMGRSKELGLKDFMDIALTTLAFLSFGMFVLQVLMCITMNKTDNSMMMMPMEIDGETTEGIEEIRRKRRSLEIDRIRKINEISRRVLMSIEMVLLAVKDEGKCLRKVLCENNKYARQQKDGQRMWIPVWGLGLSWLSTRFTPSNSSTMSTLNCLKASAIGLGGGDCNQLYSDCKYSKLMEEKRESQRKRRDIPNIVFEWSL